jgi:hypothetical protein
MKSKDTITRETISSKTEYEGFMQTTSLSKSVLSFVFILGTVFGLGCSGVERDDTPPVGRVSRAVQSLMLGQTQSPLSPVATTAGLNSGESVIVLNREAGSTDISHVLYVSKESDVARVTVGGDGLPLSVQTENVSATFLNATTNTIDVILTFIRADGSAEAGEQFTVPLTEETQKLLTSSRLNRIESPDVVRRLLLGVIVAVRTFGCAGQDAASFDAAPAEFLQLTASACGSLLLDVLRIVTSSDDDQEIESRIVEGLSERSTCDFTVPGWLGRFDDASDCALNVSSELSGIIQTNFPTITSVLAPPTPSPEPTPVASDSSSSDTGGEDPMMTPNCNKGVFQCGDGGLTCRENLCDGNIDCANAADESGSICTAEVLCCIASNGCPLENAGSCAPTCCCCGSNQQCDQSDFLKGCQAIPFS